jgi:flavoprotein hydroxylase
LLDTHGPERSAHAQHAIGMSVELGKVICVTDPEQAAQRDAFMIGQGANPARILPPLPPSALTTSVLHRPTGGDPAPGAGVPTPRVSYRGRTGRIDEVLRPRFVLGCTENPEDVLDADQRAFLDAINAAVQHLVSAGDGAGAAADAAVDLDGVYVPHMREAGHVVALIRPDHYLFDAASAMTDLSGLVDHLRRQMTAAHPAPVATIPIPYTKGRRS